MIALVHDSTSKISGAAAGDHQKKAIGVIGVGAMGGAVARRLIGLGYKVHVRDIRREPMEALERLGAIACTSPAELAEHCDVIIVLVVDADQIHDVLFGSKGAVERLRAGSLVILSSTISPQEAAGFVSKLAQGSMYGLDAPISGGPAKAEAGTLSMMLAADPTALAAAEAILPLLSSQIFHVSGRPGDGARFKLLNNILAAINLCAGAEIMALGEKMGLDTRRVLEVIGLSSGASWVVQDRMPRALDNDFEPRAATRILAKDVSLFMDLARQEGFPAVMASQSMQLFQAALANDLAEEDDAALIKLYRILTRNKNDT